MQRITVDEVYAKCCEVYDQRRHHAKPTPPPARETHPLLAGEKRATI
jgi:hypothetical protein